MDAIFKGIFDTELTKIIGVGDFLICLGVSLILGLIMAVSYTVKNEHTKSFLVTLALLPAVVCVVIMMVNGNIGAGVAVAGAFSLVRFRSAPGSAKEIVAIFLSMGAGLSASIRQLPRTAREPPFTTARNARACFWCALAAFAFTLCRRSARR